MADNFLIALPSKRNGLLITGATGFVGRALICRIADEEIVVKGVTRRTTTDWPVGVLPVVIDSIARETAWAPALEDVNTVVHLAARVHVMRDHAGDPLAEYRRVNVEGTLNLARQAARAGVRRFIFVSSIKVNGEETFIDKPYTADMAPAPVDPYAVSKSEAEIGLKKVAEQTGMELVVLRPVLVYGPGVKGNFLSMMRLMALGIPLPLGSIENRRSFLGIDNLVDLIWHCVDHPRAVNETFLVSDGEDVSTTELLQRLASCMGRRARLFSIPTSLLNKMASLAGKESVAKRLLGSLYVDISKTREQLAWTPPVSFEEGLRRTVDYYWRYQQDRN